MLHRSAAAHAGIVSINTFQSDRGAVDEQLVADDFYMPKPIFLR